ncbi:hypothetical protein SAMN05421636_103455 [Pricia antarctica]|uniref:WG containing repeat-containing protein n=1 Tax=Pricia antarctica TaxID=641691 RepID=A0A1G7AMG8_9FLAO|nr:DUF6515 family protein [Pricia antarctica]SDE16049.1 hypothetical protein SAMN05421636_103455 [Pricia antarctica]
MKKLGIYIVCTLFLSGGALYAQQKSTEIVQNEQQEATQDMHPFLQRKATVNDSLKVVLFGTGGRFAEHRGLAVDLEPLKFEDTNYYLDHGDFYIYNGGRYLLVAPPTGLQIGNLKEQVPHLQEVGNTDYYGNGVFYRKSNANAFETEVAPEGAIIYELPILTETVTIDDEAYYEYLGVLYDKVFVDGEQGFKVVGELME